MRFSIILVVLFCLISNFVISQEYGYFTGTVLDDETGSPLIGAHIRNQKNPLMGTIADLNGNFLLKLDKGIYTFIIAYTGMKSDTVSILIKEGETIEKIFRLQPYVSELSGVEITVGKFDKRIEEITVSMEVIKPDLIENKNTTDIQTILDYTPGLNILDGEPQIRGGSGFTFGVGSKVGVFVDDMPVLSGDANRPYWELIPVENIKQIEVIKGASSVLSGSSALSGAIYVRTCSPELKPLTKIRLYGGFYSVPKYSYMKWWNQFPYIGGMNLLHTRIFDNTDVVIGADVKFDHGFEGPPKPNKFVIDTVTDFTEAQMAQKRYHFYFNLRRRNKKFEGLNYGINGNFMYDKSKMMIAWLDDSAGFYRAYPGALLLQDHFIFYLDPFINLYSKLGFKHSLKARVMFNDNQMSNNQSIRNTVIFADYNFRRDYPFLKGFQFIGGISTQYTSCYSPMYSSLGSPYNKMFNLSGYAEIENDILKVINFSVGIRFEHFSTNNVTSNLKSILRAGASLKLYQETYLRMSVGQGYRYPTIAERFIKVSFGALGVFDNPELVPETSLNMEVGIKQGFKFLNYFGYFDISFFQQDYQNTVEYLFGPWDTTYTIGIGGFCYKFLNTGKSRITGVDISLTGSAKIGKNLIMNTIFGYNYIMPKSLEPDYVFATVNYTGNPIEFSYRTTSINPEKNILKYRFLHAIKADVAFNYKRFSIGLSMKYYSKIENLDKAIADFEHATGSTGGSLQPIKYMNYFYNHNNGNFIMDIRISYEFLEKHKIALISNNVTNRWYSLRPLKAEPMRTIMLQYTLKL